MSKKKAQTVLIVGLALTASASSFAGVDAWNEKEHRPGNWWVYSNNCNDFGFATAGLERHEVGAEADLITVRIFKLTTDCAGQGYNYYRPITGGVQLIRTQYWDGFLDVSPPLNLIGTLEIGDTRTSVMKLKSSSAEGEMRVTDTVLGRELVPVPAGRFMAYKIHERSESSSVVDGTSILLVDEGSSWYVQGVGLVKAESSRTLNGIPMGTESSELIATNLVPVDADSDGEDEDCSKYCGDPINYTTGNSFQKFVDIDGTAAGGEGFVRYYNSRVARKGSLGWGWSHSFDRRLEPASAEGVNFVQAYRHDGKVLRFLPSETGDGSLRSTAGQRWKLQKVDGDMSGVCPTGWLLSDGLHSMEAYDASGQLCAIFSIDGTYIKASLSGGDSTAAISAQGSRRIALNAQATPLSGAKRASSGLALHRSGLGFYWKGRTAASGRPQPTARSTASAPALAPDVGDTPVRLDSVTTQFGRKATFTYGTDGRISGVAQTGGSSVSYAYDADGNLSKASYADGTSKSMRYDEAGRINTGIPIHALTSVQDEAGQESASWTFDSLGRATSSQNGAGLNKTTVEYASEREATITDPAGSRRTVKSEYVAGQFRPSTSTAAAMSSAPYVAANRSFDKFGNVVRQVDFAGAVVCRSFDTAGTNETARIEGLGSTVDCAPLLAGSALPSGARRTSSQWHPDWKLHVRVAEPGRLITTVYNGQPDPFDSNRRASCAPTLAALPDGKPIVVPCKRVEQATTDADGSKGFSAAIQSGPGMVRTWKYSYNQFGQVLTVVDPLGNTTTNEYYGSTSTDYTQGDLKSTTNALGHIVSYLRYMPSGELLQFKDPNGVQTDYSYTPRGKLQTITTAGRRTSFDYWPTGLLKQATQADGSTLNYEYDAAHRLIRVTDGLGNRIEYTLDSAGNRTSEQVLDSSGRLTMQVSRVMDALGRVQRVTGRQP